MKITWDATAMRFLVTYNEIELWPYVTNLQAQDYRLRLQADHYFGTAYPTLTVETDTIGATFFIAKNQMLWRPFYKGLHIATHGLDCLPWYQVKGRIWEIACEENNQRFVVNSKVWPRLYNITNLRQLREDT